MVEEKDPLKENNQGDDSCSNMIFEMEDLSITVKKGVKMSDIGYCQIHFYQFPNETESYESSEKYKMSDAEVTEREISWKLEEKTTLKMQSNLSRDQYQVTIELFSKNGNRKQIGSFHLGIIDVANHVSDKGKKRNLKSFKSKKVSAVDIKYKIYKEHFGTPNKMSNDLPIVVLDSTTENLPLPAPADVLQTITNSPSSSPVNVHKNITNSPSLPTDVHEIVTNSPSLPANDTPDEKNQSLQSSFRSSFRNLNFRRSLNLSHSSTKRHSRKFSNDLPPDILESTSHALSNVPETTSESSSDPSPPDVPDAGETAENAIQPTIGSNPPPTEEVLEHPAWKPKSCIIVIGTTGRGKTTTVNIYTGQSALTGSASHSTTKLTHMYRDILPEHQVPPDQVMYPSWLDTVGLDESEAEINNGDLLRSYLECLQKKGMSWVHAIIWNITPEEKQIQMLADQANFIKEILGTTKENIWKNVIIIVKGMCNDKDFQGALSAVSAIEKGHEGIVNSIQRLQYTVDIQDQSQVKMARSKINQALCNITEPLQVIFTNKICLDCGQEGDERLLSDMCHEVVEKIPTTMLRFKIKKKVCAHCKKKWTRKQFGQWKYTQGIPCVRIRNQRDIGDGETMATNKKSHNMVDIPKNTNFLCFAPQTLA